MRAGALRGRSVGADPEFRRQATRIVAQIRAQIDDLEALAQKRPLKLPEMRRLEVAARALGSLKPVLTQLEDAPEDSPAQTPSWSAGNGVGMGGTGHGSAAGPMEAGGPGGGE